MRYQAPLTLEQKLKALRADYKEKAQVDFSEKPSKFSAFFGSKNPTPRLKQIELLEAVAELKDPFDCQNDQEAYFDKYHLMVALAYITHQKIYSGNKVCPVGSKLYELLHEALDLTDKENSLDQHTINECMYTLKKFGKTKLNRLIVSKGGKALTETEWQEYKMLTNQHIKSVNEDEESTLANSLSYVTGIVFKPVGWGIGFAFGKTIGKAGTSAPVKAAITTAIGSAFVFLGPITGGGMAAATLLARPHAEDAVEYAAGYGAAQILGNAFQKVGQGLGYVIGTGLDLAIDATKDVTGQAVGLLAPKEELNIKVGLDLVDKELTARSSTLSQEEFIERISSVILEQEAAMKKVEKGEKDIVQPRVLQFALSKQEEALLPRVLKLLYAPPVEQQNTVGLMKQVQEQDHVEKDSEERMSII